ncbi:tyrosine-type recombinase/integrase [Natronoarchaeum mannanilyticum]|uniref:Tyrosine-type recombinase/integrase n=1 Tax=Natronoarchaeum mannanilyticum TaxID=926360 RepID=A0AAV3T5P1_9EURY
MSDELQPLAPEAAVDLYLDSRRDEVTSETLTSHKYRLKMFVEWCEENSITNINDLSGRDLHAYRVDRRDDGELKPVTLRGQLSTLRAFLRFCASVDAVPEGLASKVLLPTLSESDRASETKLDPERAEHILEYVSRYQYASRTHVVFALLWRTGIRTGSIRALDMGDFYPEEQALELVHRPETGTPLKNKQNAERMVALDGRLIRMLEEYIDGPRHDKTDEYDREPLVTTQQGRPAASTIRDTIYRITRPCTVGKECPHDRDPDDCPAMETRSSSRCPSSRSPHDIRSGAITAHLLEDVPVEIVSERCDVSRDVLDRHYDRRTEREKMEQRRDHLPTN